MSQPHRPDGRHARPDRPAQPYRPRTELDAPTVNLRAHQPARQQRYYTGNPGLAAERRRRGLLLLGATGLVLLALVVGTVIAESLRSSSSSDTPSTTSPYSQGQVYGRQLDRAGYSDAEAEAACRSRARTAGPNALDPSSFSTGCWLGFSE